MFKLNYLRNILLVSIAIAILFPLYNIFVAYPSMLDVLTKETEDEAQRTANHLSHMLFAEKINMDQEYIASRRKLFESAKEDFNIFKVKLFSPEGVILYSSAGEEIGKRSDKPHFYNIVAKGSRYSKLKKKSIQSPGGKTTEIDVVSAYVPLMENGVFMGAFETYYDVTARKKKVLNIIARSSALLLTISFGFLALMYMALLKTKKNIVRRMQAEDALRQHRNLLDEEVKERTADLMSANLQLEMQIRERIKGEKLLVEAKDDWERTFDAITDMITISDMNQNIVRANRAARDQFSLPLNQKAEHACFTSLPELEVQMGGNPGAVSLKEGKSTAVEIFEPKLNKYLEVRAMPRMNQNNDVKGIIHVIRDVSDRKGQEEMIRLQVKRLSVLHSIERAITSVFDLRLVLETLGEQITTNLDIDAVNVLVYQKHTHTLEFMVSKGFRTEALKFTSLKLGESNAGRSALTQRIITIEDLSENPGGFERSQLLEAEEFVSYCAVPMIAKGQIKGVLELFNRSRSDFDEEFLEFMETITHQGAIAVDNATLFEEIERSNIELILAYDETIEGWSRAMDMRDHETEGHSKRVSDITVKIAKTMGVDGEDLVHIRRGALLHDMGKMAIPDSILLKPGKLSDEEWKVMKQHPEYAYEMLHPIKFLRKALDIPLYHHERWDGTGYPRGLKGEMIPIPARIFAVADVWDALSSDRPYRPAWDKEKVDEHIRSQSGTHFDPNVASIFFQLE